jgi:hypothetical protein
MDISECYVGLRGQNVSQAGNHEEPSRNMRQITRFEEHNLLGCDAVWPGRSSVMFRGHELPPSSGSKSKSSK